MRKTALGLIVVLAAFGACAQDEEPQVEGADRTVVIQMRDNHFEPDRLEVERGETVAFRFVNRGSVRHDAFIGDSDEQDEHESEARMADGDEHDGGHEGETNALTLEPGKRGTLTHRFTESGRILIGCHEPGHYAAGMIATVTVE